MAVYVAMLVLCLLALVTTWGGFVWIIKFLLVPFRLYVGAVGSLNFATIPVSISIVGMLTYFAIATLLSRYIFLTRVQKCRGALIAASSGLVLGAICALVAVL